MLGHFRIHLDAVPIPTLMKPTIPFFIGLFSLLQPCLAADQATILETKVISHQPEFYHGWSTVVRRANGELWLSWSGGRESHVCPFGQVHAMTSRDDGKTWTWPRVLLDGAIDDRDSGVLETAKGTLLVTTFTSLAYEPYLEKQASFAELKPKGWETQAMKPVAHII